MARPYTSEQSASAEMPALRLRRVRQRYSYEGHESSLRWNQLKRAVLRQFLVFSVISLFGLGMGEAYVYFYHGESAALVVCAAFGAISGYSVAVTRELARNAIGALSVVRRNSGYAVIGAAPALTKEGMRDLPPDKRTPLGAVIYLPASPIAVAFRDLQNVASQRQLVAFIGSVPNEGATTATLCCAISAQQQGKRVIVVDCDLRRRSLTHLLECDASEGILEAAQHPENWRDFVQQEAETGLPFIPAAKLKNPWRNLCTERGLAKLFEELRNEYDLILLDCPPALTITDGAMIARGADSCIIIAAWDDTPVAALRATMRALRNRKPIPTGVCVNRAPPHYKFEARASGE